MQGTFGGHRLRLRLSGADDGRTAVFLHHGLGARESWKALPQKLRAASGCRTLVYERWGYGGAERRAAFAPGFMEAEVPTLLEIIDAYADRPVDLVGHSDGATIALLAAAWHPECVRSVVSIAAHTFVEPITTTSIRALLDVAESDGPPGWLTRFHGDRGMQLLRAWADVWLGQVHACWDVRGELASIRRPVFAIQGDADEFGSVEQLEVIARQVADVEAWLVAGVGHTPFADEDEFSRRIAEFWQRC
ncbi:MAG: alpha/beta fold hydrolase [Acidobacteriota bacterium]